MHVTNNITLWFILKIQQFFIYLFNFMCYHIVLIMRQIIHLRVVGLMNDDLERIWKEASPLCLTYYEVFCISLAFIRILGANDDTKT
jgi:hypothetical protein